MAGIKSPGGTYTSTGKGGTGIKSPGGTGTNTKTGGILIKSPGDTGNTIGMDDSNVPTFLMDEEDE